MRLTRNDKLIASRTKISRYTTFAGLATLFGSLVISFTNNENIALAYGLLAIGFILAYVGATFANKYIREPRADNAIEKALKGFDNKNHLYSWIFPVEHVLLTPNGLIVFRVKPQDGNVICKDDKWRSPFRMANLFGGMGQEPLANPVADLHNDIEAMKKWLTDKVETAALVPVDGYVIFSDPKVNLTVENSSVPALRADDLKDTLRKTKRGAALSPAVYDAIQKAMDEEANGKTTE
jgi:hypothetical protein